MKNSLRQRATVLAARAFTRWPVLGRLWSTVANIERTGDIPWTPMTKSLADSSVCLITTAGLHLKTDAPFDMDDPQGDPTFRLIPSTATRDELTITHNYYNHADADRDFNIVFPLDRMRELATACVLRGVTPTHYSFMGHIDGPHVATLNTKILPELLQRIRTERPDFVFLTPS
jgi:D-proline reductase (dithiol) PrdB